MVPSKFADYIRQQTHTNSTTFTDAEILALANPIKDEIATEIIKADEDILLIPQVADLVEDQREYPLPPTMISGFRSLYAKLDEENFIKLTRVFLPDLNHPLEEAEIIARYSNNEYQAKFLVMRGSVYILSGSIVDVSSGLKVYPDVYPSDISDLTESSTDMSVDPSTTSRGIPRSLHLVWADKIIRSYKQSRPVPIPLTTEEQLVEPRLRNQIAILADTTRGEAVIAGAAQAPSEWNNGFNL